MLYKKILKKHHNWLNFFDKKLGCNEHKKACYAWIIISNYNLIKNYSEIISPFQKYNSEDDFFNILKSTLFIVKQEHLIKSLFNKNIINKLFNLKNSNAFFDLYLKMDNETFTRFVKQKISAFHNKDEFYSFLKSISYWHNNWNKRFLLKHIYDNRLIVDKVFDENNIIILKINHFNTAKSIGTHNWCISRKECHFNNHKNVFDRLFFIYDFNKYQYDPTSMIGITITPSNFLNFRYIFNNLNTPARIGEYRDIIQQVAFGKKFDKDSFLKEVLELQDNLKIIELLLEYDFYDEALVAFDKSLKEKNNDMVALLYCLTYDQKRYDFILDYIKSGKATNKNLDLIVNLLTDFINEMHVCYDFYFLKELFEALNDNDYALNMARKLTEKESSFHSLKYLLIYVLKGKFDKEYIIHYSLKTKSMSLFKLLLSDTVIESINWFYFLSLLSDKEFETLRDIVYSLNRENSHAVSDKIVNRIKYVQLKKISEKHKNHD